MGVLSLVDAMGAPFAEVSRAGGLRGKGVSTSECPNMHAISKLDNQKWDSPFATGCCAYRGVKL